MEYKVSLVGSVILLNNKVLLDSIEKEKAGIDYCCTGSDKMVFLELIDEINNQLGTNFKYLAELDMLCAKGSGEIIAQYISRFHSESVRGYLIPHIVSDRIKDCDKVLLHLYLHFRSSDEYISKPGLPAPAQIYVRYDNAFKTLKSKRIIDDLTQLSYCPRDVYYLPYTMKMLASWRVPELKDVFIKYLYDSGILAKDVGINEDDAEFFPSLNTIKRELRYISIDCLKFYPSYEILNIINQFTNNEDPDTRFLANKTLKSIDKAINQ